jgi:hypothetical protein
MKITITYDVKSCALAVTCFGSVSIFIILKMGISRSGDAGTNSAD